MIFVIRASRRGNLEGDHIQGLEIQHMKKKEKRTVEEPGGETAAATRNRILTQDTRWDTLSANHPEHGDRDLR